MATLTSVPTDAAPSPLAFWHLLSLDAPSIAALWTWFVAQTSHVRLSPLAPVAMFLAVWTLYAADRLLDSRPLASSAHLTLSPDSRLDLEARHLFHAQHRTGFLRALCGSSLTLLAILSALARTALRLDALLGALLAAYFVLIHATPAARRLPKEIAVGLFFAAAIFIPTLARQPALLRPLLPSALLFGALCNLNCLCIYDWEHPRPGPLRPSRPLHGTRVAEPHPATRLALRHLSALHVLLISLALTTALLQSQPIALAVALAAAALLALDRAHRRFDRIDLRAAADLVLATPLLIIPLRFALEHLRP